MGTTLAANTNYFLILEGTGGEVVTTSQRQPRQPEVRPTGTSTPTAKDDMMQSDSGLGGTWAASSSVMQISLEGPETVKPTLVTTGDDAPKTSLDGSKIVLNFSEAIGTVDTSKITVKVGTTDQTISSSSRSGTRGRAHPDRRPWLPRP